MTFRYPFLDSWVGTVAWWTLPTHLDGHLVSSRLPHPQPTYHRGLGFRWWTIPHWVYAPTWFAHAGDRSLRSPTMVLGHVGAVSHTCRCARTGILHTYHLPVGILLVSFLETHNHATYAAGAARLFTGQSLALHTHLTPPYHGSGRTPPPTRHADVRLPPPAPTTTFPERGGCRARRG